jgi:hypothetical protein
VRKTKQRLVSAYYIIRGSVANYHPLLAFRAKRRNGRNGRKVIKCPEPECSWRLTDVDEKTKVELIRLPAKSDIRCQNYQKCENCGTEVGINFE